MIIVLILYHKSKIFNLYSREFFYTDQNKNTIYLYWSGGFDSTFRLCQALFDEQKIVYPIYINCNIDNCKSCKYRRKNKNQEINAIYNIIVYIKKKYPDYAKNLQPIKYVPYIQNNENITNQFLNMKLHNYNRKFNQYEAMCRYAYSQKKFIELGTVGIIGEGVNDLPMDRWGTYLRNNLTIRNNNYGVSKKNNPLYYLNFPIVYLSKLKMLKIAKKNGYDRILKLTWSCWFPKNNLPCKRCNMCKERIIKHPI
jgi:hypothetical protein